MSGPEASNSGAHRGGPLAGVRVVDLTINVLGPLATQILGDMGADVIKVETPGGDTQRITGRGRHPHMAPAFMLLNRNKRSIVLDLKKKPSLEALLRLVDGADVFVHAMRPAAAGRIGIDYATLARRNPRLVYAYGTGYSQQGPLRDRPAYDDVVQGEAGVAAIMDQVLGEPRYTPLVLVDQFSGYLLASAIGMALYHRERSGAGQEVQVPMFESMVTFVMHQHQWGRAFEPPVGSMGYPRVLSAQRRPYATRDGHISVLAVADEQWRRLFAAIDRPELIHDPRFADLEARTRNIDALYALLAECMRARPTAEWRARFDAADLPNGIINSLEELFASEYLNQTGFWQHYDHPTEGPSVTTAVSPRFCGSPGGIRRPPPTLGEHTAEILREAGYSDDEANDLMRATHGNQRHLNTQKTEPA